MNGTQVNQLLQKPKGYDYEANFVLQSTRSRSKSPSFDPSRAINYTGTTQSRAITLMGGEPVLDILVVCMAERIAHDPVLAQVYGDYNAMTLTKVLKDLFLVSLGDDFSQLTQERKRTIYSQTNIRKHVRLGLMDEEERFDNLVLHLQNVLRKDCKIKDKDAADRVERRLQATRPLLQTTKDYMDEQKNGSGELKMGAPRRRQSVETKIRSMVAPLKRKSFGVGMPKRRSSTGHN